MTATDIAQIPMSSDLGATLARGADFAGSSGAAEVSLEHLLAALCDDPDASAVLDASQIDGERLKADVVARVVASTQPSPNPQDSLGVSNDVRRILEAAAAASRGSRRRDINGAIVLAAIVGDARSTAAEILEAHGLTFDNAIRALQAALAAPREAPAPAQPAPPVADDVLARARERVQSRATPSLREIMKDMPRPAPPAAPYPAPSAEEPSVPLPEVVSAPEAEPARPQPSFNTGEVAEPQFGADPRPAAEAPAPSPSLPASLDPRLPIGGERETPQRTEPSFGGAPSANSQPSAPGPSPVGQGRKPSWSQPTWSGQQAPAQPAMRDDQSFPLPHPPGAISPDASPAAPPSDIFSGLPPRPQPSRVQPPPIPPGAPMPGGPAGARMRGPMPSNIPMGPGAPMGAPMGMPGQQRPNPNLGHDPAFRSGPAMGAPPQQRPGPEGKPRRKAKGGKAPNVETGQLAENIPRAMRVGKTSRAEIRIAKASIKALTEGLDGDGKVWQHSVAVTKAMSVRIRAPEGGFFIESASPETQWIESNLGYASDDFASWRFLITPQTRGWSSLQIIVSARTIGDGVAAETALPDQLVEVKVRTNFARTFARLFGWTIAAIVGGALATFGEAGMGTATALMHKILH
ncbi:Clp protease N-terminal domain-containing protein [Hyphomicrobium sp. 99]|uniref:Clp protease N-terminal domain-containing protein n=1 Tax=Hyphomicrobium sp. 99 TaxID=1163419 RepID=UPI001FDA6232|nr:Clp protease N-terminal domain-containing protein [Hyphomicrobium sp. 99]